MIVQKEVANSRAWAPRAPEGWHQAFADYYKKPGDTGPQIISPASLIVPIHDEERSIESFFSVMTSSDIPTDVPLQWLLITNACRDSTPQMVRQFLLDIDKNTETIAVNGSLDPGIDPTGLEAQIGAMSFKHLNTSTRGKANALRIGNRLAVQAGHRIAMSVDANVYPEPNAAKVLLGTSYKHIETAPDNTVLFHGNPQRLYRSLWYGNVRSILNKPSLGSQVKDLPGINGWMMAWDTRWFSTIESKINVAIEDYAMGVFALTEGNHTLRNLDAKVWGYKGSTLKDDLLERTRSIRGRMQLITQNPEIGDYIKAQSPYHRSFKERATDLLKRVGSRPHRAPLQIGNFLLYEWAIQQAKKEFNRDPYNQSWPEIVSSK